MSTKHLTREMLWAVARREPGSEHTIPRILAHLQEVCPTCRAEFEAWKAEILARPETTPSADYAQAFERTRAALEPTEAALSQERERVDQLLRQLEPLHPSRRLAAVEAEPERFCGEALAGELLAAVRACLPGHPEDAFAYAQLARTVLAHTPTSLYAIQLHARCLAHMGNALRAQGELHLAASYLEQARYLLASHRAGDALVHAELDSLEGSLRRAQRRLPEAVRLLRRAVRLLRRAGQEVDAAQALLTLGTIYREQGEIEPALAATREGLELFADHEEPRLALYARYNLAALLYEAGRHPEAQALLTETARRHHRDSDPLTHLRLDWLAAHLARAGGDSAAAEQGYRAVRDGFLRQELPYDVALVSLDLAALLLEQERTAEVRGLAEEVLPLFEAREVRREALAAVLLFVEAARRETLTAALLRELAACLSAVRQSPESALPAST